MKKLLVNGAILYYSSLINTTSLISPKKASDLALKVFKTPRGKKMTAKEVAFLEASQKGFIEHSNFKMPYYNWPNKGPKILLLHGWESNSYRWRSYIKDLSALEYNVLAIDAPAHGRSTGKLFTPIDYANTIKMIVEQEKINIVLGHSVGAYATILYGSENELPAHLDKLILLAPTGKFQNFMKKFFDFLKLNKKVRASFKENFIKTYGQELDYYDSHRLIKKIPVGGLLLHDKDDSILPFEDSLLINENWPKGDFVATKGYGHRLKGLEIKKIVLNYLSK